MDMTERLLDLALGDITPTARASQIVHLSTLDWAACGIAGARDAAFQDWARHQMEFGWSQTFAGRGLTYGAAALVNGTLSHALDYDDTHFGHIGHPSVVVISALLAAKPTDWAVFQEAALVGIEASIRVGLWLGRDHYQRGFHQTATAGAFGACVGLIRMNRMLHPDGHVARARSALGLCATMASGLKAQFGTMGKPLNAGLAARAAVEAENWARNGMTGPDCGLEAFAQAHGAACDVRATDGMGEKWEVETLSHKFHACCHGLHATLEALRGQDGRDVERVEVSTHPRWMTVCNHQNPTTGLEAKFSYRQVVAMALQGIDTGDIGAYTDECAQEAPLVTLRNRVHVTPDDSLSEMQARVQITRAGDVVEVFHDLATPIEIEVLGERIRAKAGRLVGEHQSAEIWQAMQAGDLTDFCDSIFSNERR